MLCIVTLSILAARVSAQDLPITVHNTAHGLTDDVVTRVVQDSRGFLWVGGVAELARFDGERFTSYGRAEGLDVGTSVNQVFPGPDGNLWIATNGAGIFRFNVTTPEPTARMTRIRIGEGRPSNRVNTILVAADGRIWAGTDAGLFTGIPPQGLQRVTLPLPARVAQDTLHVVSLVARDSWIWVGTPAGVYRCGVEPAGCSVVSPRGVRALTFGRDGRLWLIRGDGTELWRLNGDEIVEPAETIGTHWNPRRVVAASNGMLVITEDRRVIWTDSHSERILYGSPEAPRLHDILEDPSGNLWLATHAGLLGIRRQGVTLFSEHRELRAPYLLTLARQTQGRPYVLSQDDWIHRIDGSLVTSARVVRPLHIPRSQWGDTAVRVDSAGDVWLGTGAGLLRFPNLAFSGSAPPEVAPARMYTVADGLAANHIAEIFEDMNGDLWIANVPTGAETLTVWRRRSSRFEKFGEGYGLPPLSQLGEFVEDIHGTVWARLREGGLVRLGADRATVFGAEHGLPPLINALSADRDGGLWIGGSDSVLKVNETAQQIQVTPVLTRLGVTVLSLAQTQSGDLFVGTFAGLIRLNPADKSTRRFSSFDGLPRGGVEALLAEPDGSLLLIAGRTLARLTPSQGARSQLPPRCLLTAVRIGGRPVPVPESGLERIADLTVQPSQNQVELELLGLSPRLGEPLEYEYRLPGVSEGWTRAPERRVTFAGLGSGRYTFEARVSGASGTSVSPVAMVTFRVLPPWYRRWWFLTLAGTTALLAAFAAHRSRLARVLRTERLRARIATDLHDDIGSSLSQIAILAEVARRRAASSEPAIAEPLTSIATTSRDLVDSMSDIVWAVNPRTDSLGDLTRRMHRFAEETLGGANIALQFSAPRDVDLKLGADLRRELYLILKESVNNIARHSGASEAVVDLALVRSELRLVISDNGRGFDPAQRADGNGIDSMRKRAAAFGGVFNIDSTPGRGTRVMLTAHLRRVSK